MLVDLKENEWVIAVAPELMEPLSKWVEIEGMIEGVKLAFDPVSRRLEILMTKDVELARFVDSTNAAAKNTEPEPKG